MLVAGWGIEGVLDGIERLRVGPLALFVRVRGALIHDELAVIAQCDLESNQRHRRRPFEVHARKKVTFRSAEATAVTRALELVFVVAPVGCATEVRAHRADR